MSRHAWVGVAATAIAFATVPADAVTYSGTLHGVITSGSADYFNYIDYSSSTVDLVGQAISIDFTADLQYNYTDPIFGDFYPEYITNTVIVTIPAPDPLGLIGSTQTNSVEIYPTFADYAGDGHNGSFYAAGEYIPDPDFPQSVSFSFANASSIPGALTGSGTASAGFYVPFTGAEDNYAITFNFTDGFVVTTGAPEPEAWTLMILGFGAMGAVMRRQRYRGAGGGTARSMGAI